MSGTNVRGAEKQDIPRLAEVLSLAFYDDPTMRWATREDERRLPALIDLYTYCLESDLKWGGVTTTEDLQACAVWLPPESMLKNSPPLYTLRMITRYMNWCGVAKLRRWLKFGELCEAKRPKTRHHYLDFIGVHPDKQGQGYASALLHHTLKTLDSRGEPAYLESSNPRNNPLYHRHGFQTTDEIHLPDGPTLWCMWRKPQNNATCNTL